MSIILLQLVIFIVSLSALIKGSDLFVEKAEKLGLSFGISPFIIGVTIVAFGTSLPELASSIVSVREGHSGIVIANVVGSNISNILLVLGLILLFAKNIVLDEKLLNFDMLMLVISAILMYFTLSDLHLSWIEAVIYLIGLFIFLFNSIKSDSDDSSESIRRSPDIRDYGLLVAGGLLIYFGSEYTISSLTELANEFDVDESFVAITMLALGTSLPEVFTSITAVRKGNSAMAIGNVLGSNLFNTYGVMAISSFFGELIIPEHIKSFALPYMLAATFIFFIMCFGRKINLWFGVMMLVLYLYFIVEMSHLVIH